MNPSNIDFNTIKKVHFIGIGGISMSGLAQILLSKGYSVSGSDSCKSQLTKHLEDSGAMIVYGQSAENITDDIDLTVYTAAINQSNPELAASVEKGIPTITRAQLLGLIMKQYKTAIGVSGTHGKTTTTSMISHILLKENADPTILVGGILDSIGGNLRIGSSDTFITEACEYTNSFLSFFPTTAVILNVREDHMDFFKNIDDIRNSFKAFANLLPDDGTLIINKDIDNLDFFTDGLKCKILTFGIDDGADITAKNITYDEFAMGSYDLYYKDAFLGRISLLVPGQHNILNSLAAAGTALNMGFSFEVIKEGLLSYSGTNRRFQKKGVLNGVTIIDDYAHHPDEIRATLKTALNYPHRNLWVVFQPHTYTRTKAFLDDFGDALSIADKVVLADIYAAREKNTIGISSLDVKKKVEEHGTECYYFPDFGQIEEFLLKNCKDGDLLITMGAGNVVNIGENLLKN